MKLRTEISKFSRKNLQICVNEILSKMIKPVHGSLEKPCIVHGSLAKPCIVLIDCENLAFWTRSWLHKSSLKFDKKGVCAL
jgi:hypothetical protein